MSKKRKARFVVSPIKSPPSKRFIARLTTPFKSPSPKYPKCNWSTRIIMVSTPKSNTRGRKALHFNDHRDVTAYSNDQNDIDTLSIEESFTTSENGEESESDIITDILSSSKAHQVLQVTASTSKSYHVNNVPFFQVRSNSVYCGGACLKLEVIFSRSS